MTIPKFGIKDHCPYNCEQVMTEWAFDVQRGGSLRSGLIGNFEGCYSDDYLKAVHKAVSTLR